MLVCAEGAEKMTHNKKRNTAFLFEALVKEQVECVLKKNDKKAKLIEATIKRFFSPNSVLGKELELYSALSESKCLSNELAERLLNSAKASRQNINDSIIFAEQSKLIHFINKTFGDKVYEHFIPSYRVLATINGVFNSKLPLKQRVVMEQKVKDWMTQKPEEQIDNLPQEIDTIVFQQYIKNFNEKYSNLLDEQKQLLSNYILYEFGSEFDFKIFLNEECSRLLKVISNEVNNVKDVELKNNINECITNLKNISFKHIDETLVYSIMKYQELAREIKNENTT